MIQAREGHILQEWNCLWYPGLHTAQIGPRYPSPHDEFKPPLQENLTWHLRVLESDKGTVPRNYPMQVKILWHFLWNIHNDVYKYNYATATNNQVLIRHSRLGIPVHFDISNICPIDGFDNVPLGMGKHDIRQKSLSPFLSRKNAF